MLLEQQVGGVPEFASSPRSGARWKIAIALIGEGNVGAEFLRQLSCHRLSDQISVACIARSNGTRVFPGGIAASNAGSGDSIVSELTPIEDALAAVSARVRVVIDCSADDDVANGYANWLSAGYHVISPNKAAGSGCAKRYAEIITAARAARTHWLRETTVGAGLPVLAATRNLFQSGDTLQSIKGLLSGSLSWLFSKYDGHRAFTELLEEARSRGFTEPDPLDDLAGTDVARKLVILGRTLGFETSLHDVAVRPALPAQFSASYPPDEINADLLNRHFSRICQQAAARGEVYRYVASIDCRGNASCGLESVAADSNLARLVPSDNLIEFRSAHYNFNPLVIQGPGAGREVTASGVLAELIQLID